MFPEMKLLVKLKENFLQLTVGRKNSETGLCPGEEEDVEEMTNSILDSLPQAVFFLDGNFRFSTVNRAFSELAGLRAEACAGLPVSDLLPGNERPAAIEALSAVKMGEAKEAIFETCLRRGDGRTSWGRFHIVPVEAPSEGAIFSGGLQDISGLKTLEGRQRELLRELAAANQDMKEFASIVSHDLKAPLRAISSLAGWIRDDLADRVGEEGRENLDLLTERARRMYALIEGIQRYSRITRLREERTAIDVDALVTEALRRFSLPEGVRIVKETSFPVISCERTRLETVFMNLIGNAVKAVDGQAGEIRLGARAEGDHWSFWVKDNGRGIPKEHQDRIFKLFQKVLQDDEGTGIGLTLAKRIVEDLGGEIKVESSPGEGANFTFTLGSREGLPYPA